MNLALHGFLLQVIVSILNLQHGSLLCSAGEPGYLDFDNLPETNFSCQGKVIGGYYADVQTGCQMFHVCTIGQKDLVSDEIMDIKFLCLNGTVFDQETRVCERVDEVDCSKSERFYNLNLELYGNNAVTLSLHESSDGDVDPSDSLDDHQQRTTSARPTTTTTTTTTTSKPNKPSTTPASSSFSHPTGYPQHYQPQPPFPQVHTSQSKSLYDDKNGGYHHQYIFHNGERNNNQQATSYQLFSNQGVSSTTVQPPQVHQIRFSSTATPQIIHNEPSTVSPLFHATSSTIQTLLNSNVNSPALINPIFHNHGIASTTEQFAIHSNNPRETSEYRENGEQNIRPLEAVQSTNKGKVSKLTISPVPTPSEPSRSVQTKISQSSSQRISGNFLPTPATDETTIRSFYPTLRSISKPTPSSQSISEQVTQHIHVLPGVPIPQLKPHQITINLPPPDLQRIVQSPSRLLPSQSRVIVTAKASVSDESGRPLNTTQLVTLPLPTIPASYDDYKEGDESFDPFYRDVPKIRNARRVTKRINTSRTHSRHKRSTSQTKNSMVSFVYSGDPHRRQDVRAVDVNGKERNREKIAVDNDKNDFQSIKESLIKFRDILFGGDFTDEMLHTFFDGSSLQKETSDRKAKKVGKVSLEDLDTKASKNFEAREYEDEEEADPKETEIDAEEYSEDTEPSVKLDTKASDAEEYIDLTDNKWSGLDSKNSSAETAENKKTETPEISFGVTEAAGEKNMTKLEKNATEDEKHPGTERVLDVVILDPNEYLKLKASDQEHPESATEEASTATDIPILYTTEQTTEPILVKDDDSTDKQESKSSREQIVKATVTEQPKKIENKEEKVIEEESKTEKPKERTELKPNPKRKSSRIRSSRRKETKIDESKLQKDEPAKLPDTKVVDPKTVTTAAPTEAEQIDKHIFDELESQTSKEIDTRAVGHRNSYAKNLQVGKDQNTGKENKKSEVNEYETSEKESKNVKKDEDKVDVHPEIQDESTVPTLDDEGVKKDGKTIEEADSVEEAKENISDKKSYYKEESSVENESVEDESTTVISKEEIKEDSEEFSQEFSKSSHRGKSMKFEDSSREVATHRQDKSRHFSGEDEEEERESQEDSTIKSDEVNSQEVSSEYHDSTEAFYENTHEINTEDDYDFESRDDSTISSEHGDSEEVLSSRDATVEESDEESDLNDHEDSTEGVLKFTDELPKDKKEDVPENKKPPESVENIAHDYVDDNYEPDNYKEREPTDTNNLSNDKVNKEGSKSEESGEDESEDELETTTEPQKSQDEEIQMEVDKSKDHSVEEMDLHETTTSTTTTTTTTTTTARPTVPKLFKPISARKSYNYIPPTTTPNPVVIKPRHSLLNPKPARPPKSYNDLAPKPVIRRFPLLARKTATTVATTTIREEDSTENTELPLTTMEASVSTTEVSRSEENVLEGKVDKDQEKSPKDEPMQKDETLEKKNDDQDPSPSEQKSPTNLKNEDAGLNQQSENFTPYPISRLSTLASTIEKTLKEVESTSAEPETSPTPKSYTLIDVEIVSTTAQSVASASSEADHGETTTAKSVVEEEPSTTSSTEAAYQETTEIPAVTKPSTTEIPAVTKPSTTEIPIVTKPSTTEIPIVTEPSTTSQSTSPESEEVESTTTRWNNRKTVALRRQDGFNCLEKEMYRFYGDTRDCRLFHYCSPGFTSRQVLDFRFVCEEGTTFDEESQSCRHDVRSKKCPTRQW
ncbi:uncharacterized protein LOC143376949 isoform X2 [Andrena cerasifolii]|uniref:uncharacterized protein LOC143376949 isoform X2 n=1 Tax=Andrena cerasifolii TaxID=2819439 RepID=UPI004037B2F6